MNLNKSEELLKIKKNNDTLSEQTETRRQETLEIKLKRSKQTFSFNKHLELEENEMMGVPNSEVFNSILT